MILFGSVNENISLLLPVEMCRFGQPGHADMSVLQYEQHRDALQSLTFLC